jgi:phospholipid-binding lipoprotein MlaA
LRGICIAAAALLFLALTPRQAPGAEAQEAPAAEQSEDELFEELFGSEEEMDEDIIADPIEGWNRGVFWANDKLYFYLFKPVARGWRAVTPKGFRRALGRAVSNFFAPVRAINAFLQGKIDDGGNEIGRFMVNSTIGIGGLFDPVKKMSGIGEKHEDLGQTFGTWGAGPGFYIVWPILGPSSLRDTAGFVGDIFIDPFYWTVPERQIVYIAIKGGDFINATSLDPDTYESIVEQQLDPYAFVRNAWAQKRATDIGK